MDAIASGRTRVESVLVTYKTISEDKEILINEWWNGEGFDVYVGEKIISMDYDMFHAILVGLRECELPYNIECFESE